MVCHITEEKGYIFNSSILSLRFKDTETLAAEISAGTSTLPYVAAGPEQRILGVQTQICIH